MKFNLSVLWAILAAALYAISSPVSKILLDSVSPTMMAALLYLGAGAGMSLVGLVRKRIANMPLEKRLTRKNIPYIVGMVILDIAAPIFLMAGLARTASANVSLLNNFEIVATALIALMIFKEQISRRLGLAIGLITLSGIILSIEDASSFRFSIGSIFVILACICWGFENNCTRMSFTCLSHFSPLFISAHRSMSRSKYLVVHGEDDIHSHASGDHGDGDNGNRIVPAPNFPGGSPSLPLYSVIRCS